MWRSGLGRRESSQVKSRSTSRVVGLRDRVAIIRALSFSPLPPFLYVYGDLTGGFVGRVRNLSEGQIYTSCNKKLGTILFHYNCFEEGEIYFASRGMEYQSVGDGMVAINVEDELIPHVYSPLHLAGHQFPNISENIAPSNAGSTTIPTEISHSASSKQFGSPARQLHRQNSTPITQREIQEALDHSILSSDNDNSLLIHPQQDNHQETLDGRVGHQTDTAEDTAIGTGTSEDYKWFERLKLVSSIGESTPRGLSEVVPTFYCNICLENSATSNGFILQKCSLRHQFCKACMGSYVESQIVDGCVHLGCPLVTACGCYAEDAEIEALCEEDIYSKYVKFKAMKGIKIL